MCSREDVSLNYLEILEDDLLVRIKLGRALVDSEKTLELEKCFTRYTEKLDRLHCILQVIGAEDIWEKYKDLLMHREEIEKCIEQYTEKIGKWNCIQKILKE